jgi:hypothetical protein
MGMGYEVWGMGFGGWSAQAFMRLDKVLSESYVNK